MGMARQCIPEARGGLWHVTARGVNRQTIFFDDQDFDTYIRLLGAVVVECGWILLAFCLMPNHVHLLIETPEENRARGMHQLQFKYATYVNAKYVRDGHLFQGRYRPTPVTDELHFIACATYIAANASRAGLCSRPDDWPWSSLGLVKQGVRLSWLAHDELCDRLTALTGGTFFEEWIG